jgi:ATP-dependent DNA helicase RecG
MWWQEPITILKGFGPKKAAEFAAINVSTVGELLEYYPRQDAYIDYGQLKKINELSINGERQLFRAQVVSTRRGMGAHGRRYVLVTVRDDTAYASLFLFASQGYLAQKLKPGDELLITGRVRPGKTSRTVSEISFQQMTEEELAQPKIEPVYALAGELTQGLLRKAVHAALKLAEQGLPESLPEGILRHYGLPDRLTALRNIHFPPNWQALYQARRRFILEELFLLQCGLLYYRRHNSDHRQGIAHAPNDVKMTTLIKQLPFSLTPQQEQVWREINGDMEAERPMHRILQGDVGSGKTVVSSLALAKAAFSGHQACIMVPTEILARQHYATLREYLEPSGLRIALLVGGMPLKARRRLLEELELGMVDIVVGTHALLQEDVRFADLSLAVTDEQHRFGVEQRAKLLNKSTLLPDILIMTATPIPRTLALTVYGDLDISVMKGRPPGRKPVQTLCYSESKRQEVYRGLLRQIKLGRQAYIVCPLIEESEGMDSHSAEQVYAELSDGVLREVPCALLHGRLKAAEKDAVMNAFAAGEIKVLVSTTVIEVGVNVPNATLMVIENAERFGLSQLHQLRGRVGRGSEQSYCVLFAGTDASEALARLQVLRDSEDGFYLAEKDLDLRGAGQLFGLRQHGLPDLRIADIIRDTDLIKEARRLAEEQLAMPGAEEQIRQLLSKQFGQRFDMIFNS